MTVSPTASVTALVQCCEAAERSPVPACPAANRICLRQSSDRPVTVCQSSERDGRARGRHAARIAALKR